MDNIEKLVSCGKAAKILGVHPNTLILWEQEGRLSAIKTPGGHRRFKISELEKIKGYLTPSQAAEMLGASTQALIKWSNDGKISVVKTDGGHRRYLLEDIRGILGLQ